VAVVAVTLATGTAFQSTVVRMVITIRALEEQVIEDGGAVKEQEA